MAMPNNSEITAKVGYGFSFVGATGAAFAAASSPAMDTAPHVTEPPFRAESSTGEPMKMNEKILAARLETLARTDHKIARVQAASVTQFKRMLGKLDVISEQIGTVGKEVSDLQGSVTALDGKTNNTQIIIMMTAIRTVIGIVGLLYTMVGYGNAVADSVTSAYGTGVTVGDSRSPAK